MVDYYFFYGPSIDQVVARLPHRDRRRPAVRQVGVRALPVEGQVRQPDRAVERQERLSQQQHPARLHRPGLGLLDAVLHGARTSWMKHAIPIPASLITQMHAANVHTMISIWPVYQYVASPRKAGELDNYNALNGIGALYATSGTHHFYDTFNAAARTLVYQQIYDRLLGQIRLGRNLGRQHRTAGVSGPRQRARGHDRARQGGALHQRLSLAAQQGRSTSGGAAVGPNGKRVYILTRSGFAGQQRYATTCWSGDIDSNFPTLREAGPRRAQFLDRRDALLDHRHRRLLGAQRGLDDQRQQRALHPLVPVRRLLSDLPGSRRRRARALRQPVERHDQGQSAQDRQPALSLDAVHLFVGLEGHQRGVHDDAAPGVRLSERHERVQHQGSVPVRSCVPGQSGDRRRRDQPVGLFPCRDLVRLLDGSDDDRRQPA